jgi:hypothetical protein
MSCPNPARIMRERGRPFDDGEVVPTGGRLSVKVINGGAQAKEEYAIKVGEYYNTDANTIEQVLIPDKEGKFSRGFVLRQAVFVGPGIG